MGRRRLPGSHADRHVGALNGGWLVGFDAGEFGGSLWWYPAQGGAGRKLSDENVVAVVPSRDLEEALAFFGLAHLHRNFGGILKVRMQKGAPEATVLADLGRVPRAAVGEETGTVLLLTEGHLERIWFDGRVADLCQVNLEGLYPNSLTVAPSGAVYAGMRHYVVRLSPGAEGCLFQLAPGPVRHVGW